MSSSTASDAVELSSVERLDGLFDELAELAGQRNAIDGRMVEIVAEIDRDRLWGSTGARSLSGLVAWKLGASTKTATTITAVAQRWEEFPRCTQSLREGRVSLDQVGVIAQYGGAGSDDHYAQLIEYATVSQLRTATKLEPPRDPKPKRDSYYDADPDPDAEPQPAPVPEPTISKTVDVDGSHRYHITLPAIEAAKLDAALHAHHEGMLADWKHDRDTSDSSGSVEHPGPEAPPMPTLGQAFVHLVESSWDAEAARRPHGQRTTVVVHVDVNDRIASLHLGPLLADADRQYLLCDASCEVWFERDGQPIGAGRSTRSISRRLRRALEYRHPTCAVPGCGATRGLHAHHIQHWEDGGLTELDNLVLVCPHHHRLHHRGLITITGPADRLTVTDSAGRTMSNASLARPPTTAAPAVPPCPGPTGERAQWWWYDPYEPPPQPLN
ncbi:HNH endonuclease signature motif containing protein [Mycolicibacterium sp. XJ879]